MGGMVLHCRFPLTEPPIPLCDQWCYLGEHQGLWGGAEQADPRNSDRTIQRIIKVFPILVFDKCIVYIRNEPKLLQDTLQDPSRQTTMLKIMRFETEQCQVDQVVSGRDCHCICDRISGAMSWANQRH